MSKVYILSHGQIEDDEMGTIGVYSTFSKAICALEKYLKSLGYMDKNDDANYKYQADEYHKLMIKIELGNVYNYCGDTIAICEWRVDESSLFE